jgi:hypothetical protein
LPKIAAAPATAAASSFNFMLYSPRTFRLPR